MDLPVANSSNMKQNRYRQIKHELENWLRRISSIQQQNVHLKNTLAEIIKHDITPAMLEDIEFFQNQFLNKDTLFTLLRYDIATQNKLAENGIAPAVSKKQDMLRTDVERVEKEFSLLQAQFNDYLGSIHPPMVSPRD